MGAVELLKPIKADVLGKVAEELLNKVENNTFHIVKGIVGTGQEFLMQVLSEKANRQCVSIDLDLIEEFEDANISKVLSLFSSTAITINKDLIIVIKQNKTIDNDLTKIAELKKKFEEMIFNKLNAVVFYIMYEKNITN